MISFSILINFLNCYARKVVKDNLPNLWNQSFGFKILLRFSWLFYLKYMTCQQLTGKILSSHWRHDTFCSNNNLFFWADKQKNLSCNVSVINNLMVLDHWRRPRPRNGGFSSSEDLPRLRGHVKLHFNGRSNVHCLWAKRGCWLVQYSPTRRVKVIRLPFCFEGLLEHSTTRRHNLTHRLVRENYSIWNHRIFFNEICHIILFSGWTYGWLLSHLLSWWVSCLP